MLCLCNTLNSMKLLGLLPLLIVLVSCSFNRCSFHLIVKLLIKRLALASALVCLSPVATTVAAEKGLVNHWKFDGNYKDAVGQKHALPVHTEVKGPPSWEAGRIGQAVTLGDSVLLPYPKISGPGLQTNAECPNTATFTVSWWWRPDVLGGGGAGRNGARWSGRMGTHHDDVRWNGWYFHSSETGAVYCGVTTAKRFTPKDIPAGTVIKGVWQMLTFTLDHGTGRFYKNGALIATKTGMPAPIRWRGFHMTHWFNGGLDDVRLYNRALSNAEVATLYRSASKKVSPPRVGR